MTTMTMLSRCRRVAMALLAVLIVAGPAWAQGPGNGNGKGGGIAAVGA